MNIKYSGTILPLFFIASILNVALAKENVDLRKVSQGNMTELNRAFEEHKHSDGEVAENLEVAIGESIRANPVNFLRAYKSHPKFIALDHLVSNLGPEFADDFKNQGIEVRKRIAALQKVKKPSLKDEANVCIIQLEKFLKQINTARTGH